MDTVLEEDVFLNNLLYETNYFRLTYIVTNKFTQYSLTPKVLC